MGQLTRSELLKKERIFLSGLSTSMRKKIQKLNPFRFDRDRAIQALFARGVPQCLLSKASGLSIIQIARIVRGKRKNGDGASGSTKY